MTWRGGHHEQGIKNTHSEDEEYGRSMQEKEKMFIEYHGRCKPSLVIKYQRTRLEQYKNYENIPNSGESVAKPENEIPFDERREEESSCEREKGSGGGWTKQS